VAQVATLLTAECILFRLGAGVPYLLHFRGVPLAGPEGKPPGPVDQCWFKELIRLQYSILPAAFKVEAADAPTTDLAPIDYLRRLHEACGTPYPLRLEGIAHAVEMPREGVEASLAAARAARLVREAAAAAAASTGLIPVLSLPVSPAGVAPLPRQTTAVGHTSAQGPVLPSTTVARQPAGSSLAAAPLVGRPAPLGGLPSSALGVPSADSGVPPVGAAAAGGATRITTVPRHQGASVSKTLVVVGASGPALPKHHPQRGAAAGTSALKHHPPSKDRSVSQSGGATAVLSEAPGAGPVSPALLCGDCGDAVVAAVLVKSPKVGMVMLPPSGVKRTGGRARLRARILRDLGAPPPPDLDDLSPEALLIRVARREEVIRLRRVRRADLVLMRALLLRWEADSGELAAEVHSERWFPHKWAHWVFPHATSDPQELGQPTAVSFRTVADFVAADTFGWREVLQRVIGKAEVTPGGLSSLFPPTSLGRIDTFVSTFAEAHPRHAWLHTILNRLRRLRAWQGPLAPGPMSVVSRPSRKARLVSKEKAMALNLERLRRTPREVLPLPLGRAVGSLPPILELPRDPGPADGGDGPLFMDSGPRTRPPRTWAPYLRKHPGNALIHGLLHGSDRIPVGSSKPPLTSVRLRPSVAST
jgi:hypothetical protein